MTTTPAERPRDHEPARGLRIGQAAAAAGLTVRAIRHYHACGLLPEPPRDSSGYRRYRATELVTLVRISRLRAVGMPLEQIAAALAGTPEPAADDGVRRALTALAADVADEIERLSAVRHELLRLAEDESVDPSGQLVAALSQRGLLPAGAELPEHERAAVDLVEALHPGGVRGALATLAPALDDPARRAALDAALQRLAVLDDTEVETLARALAQLLPLPAQPVASVDLAVMDQLSGGRLSEPQRRCMLRTRELLQARMAARGAS